MSKVFKNFSQRVLKLHSFVKLNIIYVQIKNIFTRNKKMCKYLLAI